MVTKAQLQAEIAELRAVPSLLGRVQAALPPVSEMGHWLVVQAELAKKLASELDAGVDPKSLASVAREFRECIKGLEADLGGDDAGDEEAGFFRRMSSPLGDGSD